MSTDVKAATLVYIEGLKKAAQEAGDVEGVAEASKLRALVETEGLKIVKKPGHHVFVAQCLAEEPHPESQGATREKMKGCAKRWGEMSEEEKKKYGDSLELREF